MTTAQRIIATMGLALIFGRFLSAPYHFQGHDPLYLARTGEERIVIGRVHAPFWAPPNDEQLIAKARVRMRDPELQLDRLSMGLDWTRFLLWVAAIAIVTLLAIGAPSSRAGAKRGVRD